MSQDLAGTGVLTQSTAYDFEFKNVEKPFESYTGINLSLRYFLRVTISRRMSPVTHEKDIWVHTYAQVPEGIAPKMEVGIEECLHIEFEFGKDVYHLKDVVVGRIYFLMVRVKIVRMELSVLRREVTGSGMFFLSETRTLILFFFCPSWGTIRSLSL